MPQSSILIDAVFYLLGEKRKRKEMTRVLFSRGNTPCCAAWDFHGY
jgi:hypothetical protein